MNFNKAFNAFNTEINEWIDGILFGLPNFTAALFALVVFLFASRLLKAGLERVLLRMNTSQPIRRLATNSAAGTLSLAGIIVALGIMNLDTTVTSLLTGAGIIGLGISFAFQDVVSNLFSGILIAIQKPFSTEDIIESNGVYGKVKKIGLRQVEIENLNGQDVWIPARQVLQNVLKNYTRNKRRRVVIETGISYNDDLDLTKKVTLNAINDVKSCLQNMPIKFFYTNFGESAIKYQVFFWINFNEEVEYLEAVSDAIVSIKKAYNENEITITFPIRTIDFGIKGGKTLAEMLNQK